MRSREEPAERTLPAWDATEAEPGRPPRNPGGSVGLRIYSVSEVTRAVRDAVRAEDRLRDVWVEGEVGRVTVSSAGHAYFTLKDLRSQLSCVWFRDDRISSPFEPQTGLRVVAHGRIDVFDQQGVYQLYVSALQPAGFGDLALRYEALKAKLAAEGLFDTARKRALPVRPATIGVVTSPTGAVWHDIGTILERRWPLARVLLVACQVQGDGAPASIVGAIERLGRWIDRCRADGRPGDAPEVTILARGGGSLEDLWSFNDERVVRAVIAHPVPIVCGVGHEVDVTLADFAADIRAPTPSAAAELVTPDRVEIARSVDAGRRRLDELFTERAERLDRELAEERRALDRLSPAAQLAAARERAGLELDRATRSIDERLAIGRRAQERAWAALAPLPMARLKASRAALETAEAALNALGPQGTLERGYAIVRRIDDGRIVRSPADAGAGTRLAIRLAGGELPATADRRE